VSGLASYRCGPRENRIDALPSWHWRELRVCINQAHPLRFAGCEVSARLYRSKWAPQPTPLLPNVFSLPSARITPRFALAKSESLYSESSYGRWIEFLDPALEGLLEVWVVLVGMLTGELDDFAITVSSLFVLTASLVHHP